MLSLNLLSGSLKKNKKQNSSRTSLAVQWLKLHDPKAEGGGGMVGGRGVGWCVCVCVHAQFQFLVGEHRFCILCGAATKNNNN